MKGLFIGLKRAKVRTILSAVIIVLCGAGTCISTCIAMKPSVRFVPLAIIVAGLIFLVLVNFISSKKRNAEFSDMTEKGITVNQIKKQMISEVLAVALVFGVIGCGVGVAVAKPISNKIMSSHHQEMPSNDNGDNTSGATTEGQKDFDKSKMPKDFDKSKMPKDFDKSNKPNNSDKDNMPSGDNAEKPNGMKNGYTSLAVNGVLALAIFSVASVLGVCLPIKKEN